MNKSAWKGHHGDIFGGIAQMKGEPPHPKAEFRIAVAGPLSSFLITRNGIARYVQIRRK